MGWEPLKMKFKLQSESISGVPSKKLEKKMKEEERARISSQKLTLGIPDGHTLVGLLPNGH